MWQEVLIIIIGLFAIGYVVLKVIKMFTGRGASPCAGCTADCALKDTKEALTENCKKKQA